MIPKFRVWDKENKIMWNIEIWHVEDEYFDLIEPDKSVVDQNANRVWRKQSDVIIMQSTGLFDKNGKEIFEGDIVRYTWDMLSDANATEKGKKVRISKVFWSDWKASWAVGREFCNNDLFRYVRNGNTVEVIGNVYQNPELLEEEL